MYNLLNLFVVGGKTVFQYGDSVQSFPNVFFIKNSIFACIISTKRVPCEFTRQKKKKLSGGQVQEQVFVVMEFTDQVKIYYMTFRYIVFQVINISFDIMLTC